MQIKDEKEIALNRLQQSMTIDDLWSAMSLYQGISFYTSKKLEFTYIIKGKEMFVSRKEKSITKATVKKALEKAIELNYIVAGPKKLGTFGASYLYPVFIELGIIRQKE